MVDFDILADGLGLLPLSEQKLLWNEIFKLNKWFILCSPTDSSKLFVEKDNDKLWLYICTDSDHLRRTAINKFAVKKDNGVNTTILSPEQAIKWMSEYIKQGIYGVKFNYGEHGFETTLFNLILMKHQ